MAKIISFPIRVLPQNLKQNEGELNLEGVSQNDNFEAMKNLVHLKEVLQEQMVEDRRKVQRVLLGDLIASHVVLPSKGLARVSIRDIDEGGLAFEMESSLGCFDKGDSLEMRFYLNGETYFRFYLVVAYSAVDEEKEVSRHGTYFDSESLNQEALYYFVQFLKAVSVSLKTDQGERIVSNLTS
jgi:hypothetical protein